MIAMNEGGVGTRVTRREDSRLLHGRACFVADITLPGLRDVAFVRSSLAHGYLRSVSKPSNAEADVFCNGDLTGVLPITTPITTKGFQHSEHPILASDRVRFVGEPIAACIAATRAQAEDLADAVVVEIDELPALFSIDAALREDAPTLHPGWRDNRFVDLYSRADIEGLSQEAPVVVELDVELSRQAIHPMEGRGIVAHWDWAADQLVLAMSTQMPHAMRTGIAKVLGLPESKLRIAPPDIGGGFGYKLQLLPEEVVVAWLALKHRAPFRWIEDRREHLIAGACTRQARYHLKGFATPEGRLLGLDARVFVDNGAYSVWPFTAALEGYSIRSNLPGPYQIKAYRTHVTVVGTNKPGFCPYRGIARVGTCFAIESLIDAVARKIGREASDVRALNLVPPEAMPFQDLTKQNFDIGDYPETLRRARSMIGLDKFRAEEGNNTDGDRYRTGIGFATFYEQTANGAGLYAPWNTPIIPGYDQATLKIAPDGTLEVRMGLQGFGQGIETSLAQVAATTTGISLSNIRVRLGDTENTPHSLGSFTSRSAVVGAGAIEAASIKLKQQLGKIAAHLMQVREDAVSFEGGAAHSGGASVSIGELARTFYHTPHLLPVGTSSVKSLEVTEGYVPPVDSGIFSYGTHAVKVAVDTMTGLVQILDYAVVEDCGQRINPMIVEGQTIGGIAQGIGTALFEESPYDESGQPLASTLLDYLLPGSCEIPRIKLDHLVHRSPHTSFGIKGVGESGTIPSAAAVANAINDALAPLNVRLTTLPMSPQRVLGALLARQEKKQYETSAV
jgi:carbon-monoxide dehydrogenase large subunit